MPGVLDVLGVGGDNLLGGTDFDSCLAGRLQELLEARDAEYEALPGDAAKIRKATERAKIKLSAESSTEVIVSPLGASGVVVSETVDRKEFEALISDRIEETVRLTLSTVAGASLRPEDMDQVLLVGGSSAIPLVRERLAEVFGREKLRMNVDPMTCVALGAAVQSALVQELECPGCRAACSLDAGACPECAVPLVGAPTVECPTCHARSRGHGGVSRLRLRPHRARRGTADATPGCLRRVRGGERPQGAGVRAVRSRAARWRRPEVSEVRARESAGPCFVLLLRCGTACRRTVRRDAPPHRRPHK
ncbi:Hsp70 family protein [Streptomyces mexicanus]|uniref:Hsp70 family protein n=1 Tax=Streptomyces mexicanus TaxID=178566 RepID=A0A7X1LPE6_9ACTN|nr:Hsp70 family protein [Streptomyces mexicanus]